MQSASTLKKHILTIILFVFGIRIGLMLWEKIRLPFHNPWGIVGSLAELGYNPGNNLIRFLVLISLPAFLILGTYFLNIKHLNHILFKNPSEDSEAIADTGSGDNNKIGIILLIIFAMILAVSIPTFHAWGDLDTYHEGESFGLSLSYSNGKVPYKDFVFLHGIYQDPLRSVVAFKIFGKSIGAVRTLESLTKISSLVLLAVLILTIYRGNLLYTFATVLMLLAFLYWRSPFNLIHSKFLYGMPPFNIAQSILTPLFIKSRDITTISFLITITLLQNFVRSHGGKRKWIVVTAFFFSFIPLAAFVYSVDRGAYLFAAYLIMAPIFYFQFFHTSALRRHYLISTFLGLLSGITLLYFFLHESFSDFFEFVFMTMPNYLGLMHGKPYPIEDVSYLILCLMIAANIYWVMIKFLEEFHSNNRGIKDSLKAFLEKYMTEFTLLVVSILIFRGALTRPDINHVMYSCWITYVLSIYILIKHCLHPLIKKYALYKLVSYLLVLIVGIVTIFGTYRIWTAELISKNFPVGMPDSYFIPDKYKATISFLKNNLKKDEAFLAMNSDPSWYYFIDKPCPTRFPILWLAVPPFYQREVVTDLEKGNVKFVLYKNDHWANYFEGFDTAARLPIVVDYINDNYVFFNKLDNNEIWIRKAK